MVACSDGSTLDARIGDPAVGTGSTSIQDVSPTPTVSAMDATIAQVEETVPKFSKQRAMIHVRKLADDIGVRVKGTGAERRAAKYVARKLRGFGYEVEMQRFTVGGNTSRNVVARWPGAKRFPLVVGGHIDSVPKSPGANDNASGVAAVVELARIFKGTSQVNFITFVAFGSEEFDSAHTTHHDGSAHFVEKLGRRGRRRLAGMISVDMVADGRPLLVGNSNISGRHKVANTLYNKIRKRSIAVDRITLCDCSDHGPFEHRGMDAAFAYSGPEPDYHSPQDTTPNMKPNDLLRTGRALRFFLMDVDKAMLDRFRNA